MPRISDLPLTSSVDDATSFVAVSANGTTYKISLANALAASTGATFFDSDSSHIITLAGGSNLSANRTLTLTTGDADRTLDISAGNTTISAFAITFLDDADAAAVRATLGLGSMALETATDYLTVAAAASGYQPLDADLTAIAALTSAANKVPYSTGAGTWALADFSAAGRALVDDADATAQRTTLGLGSMALETATDYLTVASAASGYQPLDADLTTLAVNITVFGHSLVDDADNTAARTTLGLGTAAVQNTGTSGANIPFLNGTNTWSGSSNKFETSSATAAVYITSSASYAIPITIESTNDDALAGPFMNFQRISSSPANTDLIGGFNFRARLSDLTETNYCTIQATAFTVTAGAQTGRLQFNTFNAGTFSTVLSLRAGAFVGSPTGFDMGAGTFNAVTIYENGTSLASKYQGLDSELTAIAGLTSAADRLPYFTGSGTASLATFTTAGRNLVDDADASAQRTTLGLGTAATQNTGTSGATIPFLNGSNTFGVQQIIDWAASPFGNGLVVQSSEDSGGAGPGCLVRRISTSPAAADQIGFFQFQGRDSAGNNQIYASLSAEIVDPTSTSEDGGFSLNTCQAGSVIAAMGVRLGVFVGSPTGGDKGVGTLNAKAVYDDSVLLCAPVEFMKSGTVNTAMWDTFAIDVHEPEVINDELVEIDVQLSEPETRVVRKRDGTFERVAVTSKKATPMDAFPVLNDKGEQVDTAWVPQTVRKVRPAKTIKRQNELAHEFKAMLDDGFDPRDPKAYFDKMLADEALPGLKTKANWVPNEESNAKRTNRIILALELQTAAFKTVYEQVEALKAEVAALKKGK